MNTIETIEELVSFLGGDTVLADLLGISQSAVGHWKIRGRIASGWHLRLLSEIRSRGADVHPSVFGLEEDEAHVLFGASKRVSTGTVAA